MYQLIKHGNELFILFLFPLVGLGLGSLLPKKIRIFVLVLSIVILFPILMGFMYTIDYVYQMVGLITLGILYSFYSAQLENKNLKIKKSLKFTGISFLMLGFAAFMDSFSGSQTVEKKWELGNYKIEYIRDQGFAGGPLMKYELSKYGKTPLFIKHIETVIAKDKADNCTVLFVRNNISFNECEDKLTQNAP